MLLEVGPQPVLTASALRAWPDPATAPRAIASLRRNTADHRQITEAVADAYVLGHLPEFAAFRQPHARKLDLPTYPFEHRQYWFRDNRDPASQQQPVAARTQAVRLLEDGRIEELAAHVLTRTLTDPHWDRESGRAVAWVSAEGVGVAPAIPALADRRASGHSIIGLAVFDRSALRAEAIGRCWSRGRFLAWLADS